MENSLSILCILAAFSFPYAMLSFENKEEDQIHILNNLIV